MGPTIRVLILMAALVLGSACSRGTDSNENAVPVRIAAVKTALSAPLYVAKEKGFFREEGLDVTVIPCETGMDAIAYLGKKADFAITADVPIAAAAFQRSDFRILATIASTREEPAVVARKDAVRSLRDLARKRVAVVSGTASDLFLSTMMVLEGVPEQSVRRVPIHGSEMAAALRSGRVDAVVAWNPHLAEAEAVPDTVVFSSEAFLFLINLIGDEKFINRNPTTCRKLLAGLLRTGEYIRDHRDEALAIVRRELEVPTARLIRTWPRYDFDLRLREPLLVQLENNGAWLLTRGEKGPLPDFRRLIAPEPLEAVDPGAVRLIR